MKYSDTWRLPCPIHKIQLFKSIPNLYIAAAAVFTFIKRLLSRHGNAIGTWLNGHSTGSRVDARALEFCAIGEPTGNGPPGGHLTRFPVGSYENPESPGLKGCKEVRFHYLLGFVI